MKAILWHLFLNSTPGIGISISLLILVSAYFLKSFELKKFFFALLLLSSLLAFPVSFSGSKAFAFLQEQKIDKSLNSIYLHEEAADQLIPWLGLLAFISAIALYRGIKKKAIHPLFFFLAIFLSAMNLFYLYKLARLGFEISHPEAHSFYIQDSDWKEKIIYPSDPSLLPANLPTNKNEKETIPSEL